MVNTNRANPLDNDRMYVTREDTTGEPLGFITIAQLSTRLGGAGGTTVAANPDEEYTAYLDDVTIGTTGYEVRGNPLTGRAAIPVGNILSSENRLFIASSATGLTPQYVTMQTFRDEVITHQGPWVGTRGYNLGHVVYTGSGESLTYWIASEAMPQGTGQPTFNSPGAWYHLGHRTPTTASWQTPAKGLIFTKGRSFVWRENLYIVTADTLGTTLSTVVAGDNVIEVTNPFGHVDELAQTPRR